MREYRVFGIAAGPIANGAGWERATIYAPTGAKAGEALEYYEAHNRPGMTTVERIDRAIALNDLFDAEARHTLYREYPYDL